MLICKVSTNPWITTCSTKLTKNKGDDAKLFDCIERVVRELNDVSTIGDRLDMLLGKIESGKTRGFVGVIARLVDED